VTAAPVDGVTVTGPVLAPQLMLSADSVIGAPAWKLAGTLIAESSGRLLQFTALEASRRRPEIVLPARPATGLAPDRIRFLIARQSRAGSCALSSAATPATNAAELEVPLAVLYAAPGEVLNTDTPGAPRCTLR